MTEAEYRLFLDFGTGLCAVAALLNLINLKRRGRRAFLLSLAFVFLAGVLWLLREHANPALVTLIGVVVFGFLVADIVIRSRQQAG